MNINKQKLLKRVLSAIFAVSIGMSTIVVDFSHNNYVEVSANSSVDFSLDYTKTVPSEYPQIENGVLKLNNFKFTTSADAAIIVPRGTTIEFSGTNIITANNGIGIKAEYDPNLLSMGAGWGLTIEGNSNSTLTINAAKQGIYVKELDLLIDNADIKINGSSGIFMFNESNSNYTFDIKNSNLDIVGTSSCGIDVRRVLGSSTWSNSTIDVVGKTLGISINGNGGDGFIDSFVFDNCDINVSAEGNSALYLEDVNDFSVTNCDEFNLSGANNGIQGVGAKLHFKKTTGTIQGEVNGIFVIQNPNDPRQDKGPQFIEFDTVDLTLEGGTTAFKTDLDYGTSDSEIIFSDDIFPHTTKDNKQISFSKSGDYTQMYSSNSLAESISISTFSVSDMASTITQIDGDVEDAIVTNTDTDTNVGFNVSFKHDYPDDDISDDFNKTTDSDGYLLKQDFYTPTYEGYTFLGWFRGQSSSDSKVDSDTDFTNIRTVYGQWEKINPAAGAQIHFDANGGNISTSSSTVSTTTSTTDSDGKISLLPNASREGYTFLGWYNSSTDSYVSTATPYSGDTYLVAKWEQTSYITFDFGYDGQDEITRAVGSTGTVIGAFPTVDNRPGIVFLGWYTFIGTKVEDGATFSSSQTLYAKWSEAHTISFDPVLNLLEPPTQTTNANSSLDSLPKMLCPGYGLDGWYTQKDGGDEVTTSTVFNEDTTIYARWVADEFTVTFKPDYSGSVEFTVATTDYKIPSLPTPASRSGYAFEGWYTKQNGSGNKISDGHTFDEDLILYALWSDIEGEYNDNYSGSGFESETGSVTITLDAQHESYSDLDEISTNSYGRLTKYPGILVANGLAFDGWYTGKDGSGEKVYEDTKFLNSTTIYGNWIEGEVTVTINQDYSGSFEIPYSTSNNRLATLPSPKVRPGYTFDGWYWVSNSTGSTDATLRDMSINLADIIRATTDTSIDSAVSTSTVFTTDSTIYASWSAIEGGTIIVSFDSNGGTPGYYIDQTGVDGRLNSLPTPTREGYTFLGWYDGNLEISTSYIFRFDTEVYAKWQLDSEFEEEQNGNPGYGGSVMYSRDVPTLERLYIDKFQNLMVGDYITGLGSVSPNRPDLGTFVGWYHGADLSRPLDYFELQSILVTEELFITGIYPKFEKNIVSTGGNTSTGGVTTQVPVTETTVLSRLF